MTTFLKLLSDECPGFKWAAFRIIFKDGEFQDLEFCEESLKHDGEVQDDESIGQSLADVLNQHKNQIITQGIENIPGMPELKSEDQLYGVVCFVACGPSDDTETIYCCDSEDGECFFNIPKLFSGILIDFKYKSLVENQVYTS